MDKKKIYVTKDGMEELKRELEELKHTKRLEVVERVARAREMGDLSENSEYTAARDELSLVDGRIEELEEILKSASIITEDHTGPGKDAIQLGSKVKLHISGKHEEFTVVGEWEADPHDRKISHESPLGKALIGRKPGDKVEVNAPAGKILYTVVSID
jgi:transcription elongation factor GreA